MVKQRTYVVLMVFFCSLIVAATGAAGTYKKEYSMSVVVGHKLPWGEGAARFAELASQAGPAARNVRTARPGPGARRRQPRGAGRRD